VTTSPFLILADENSYGMTTVGWAESFR